MKGISSGGLLRIFLSDFEIGAGNFDDDMLFFFGGRMVAGEPAHGSVNDVDNGPAKETVQWLDIQKLIRFDFVFAHASILTHPCPKNKQRGTEPALSKGGRCRPEEKLLLFLHCFFSGWFLSCFFLYSFLDCFFRGLFHCFFLGCHWRSPKNCDLKRSRPTPDTRCLKIMLPDDSKIYTQKSTIGKNNPDIFCGKNFRRPGCALFDEKYFLRRHPQSKWFCL